MSVLIKKKLFNINILVLVIPSIFILAIFSKFFLKGYLPIPTDILFGAYYPWLDNQFGYFTHVPVKNPLLSDVVSIIYPWRFLGMSLIKSGHLPLWDDTILLGVPLLANFQSALLNPANFLFFIFSNSIAWSLQTIIQPLLIFGAMYAFLRKIKVSDLASIIGALLYAFSGYVMVWLEYNTLAFALIYTPLILLIVQNILEKPSLRLAFILAILISLQIFSGYPLIAIYTLERP